MTLVLPGLSTPLQEVTFVVFDLETTGGSPLHDEITEIGALKFCGGELLGTFQTLVNPGAAMAPQVVHRTGITEAMVGPAPRVQALLPAFLEFIRGTVLVAHNARFDLAFLRASLRRESYAGLTNPVVDTCGLARRLLGDEVADFRLSTLARHFRTEAEPCHRALADAAAAGEVLHALLERVGTTGVTHLDDLLTLPAAVRHPHAAKLRLTVDLPRSPGVYVFRDLGGQVLYVGRARNVRQRVRAYFSSTDRRRIGPLLRELHSIEHHTCTDLEAAVLELRLVQQHRPRYNDRAGGAERPCLVRLTEEDRLPRLSIVRDRKQGDTSLCLGPMASHAIAQLVVEAIESVLPLRRCRHRVPLVSRTASGRPVASSGSCPCVDIESTSYRSTCELLRAAAEDDPGLLLGPISDEVRTLSSQGRHAEAADAEARRAALATALERQRESDELRRAGRLHVECDNGDAAIIEEGRLEQAWSSGHIPPIGEARLRRGPDATPSVAEAEEIACIARWLTLNGAAIRVRPANRS